MGCLTCGTSLNDTSLQSPRKRCIVGMCTLPGLLPCSGQHLAAAARGRSCPHCAAPGLP